MMQKPKPYRGPQRRHPPTTLPRHLRRPAVAPTGPELDIVFEWEGDGPTQH